MRGKAIDPQVFNSLQPKSREGRIVYDVERNSHGLSSGFVTKVIRMKVHTRSGDVPTGSF